MAATVLACGEGVTSFPVGHRPSAWSAAAAATTASWHPSASSWAIPETLPDELAAGEALGDVRLPGKLLHATAPAGT